jgi:hypothetical protein
MGKMGTLLIFLAVRLRGGKPFQTVPSSRSVLTVPACGGSVQSGGFPVKFSGALTQDRIELSFH